MLSVGSPTQKQAQPNSNGKHALHQVVQFDRSDLLANDDNTDHPMMKMTMKLHDSAVAGHGRSALPFKKRSQVVDSNSDPLSNNDDENIPLTETKLKRF
eukprot:4955199-Ditylum_brightwellii.AAC.1